MKDKNDFASLNDKEVLERIGARLKELRISQNVKQKDLAERSGLSNFSISQMETGHNTSLQSLIQVLRALGCLNMLEPFLQSPGLTPRPLRLEREPRLEEVLDAELLARLVKSIPQRKRVSRTYAIDADEEEAPFLMAAEDETKYGK